MTLKVYTDGGARGNPGPASIGIVFYLNGKKVFSHREDIGVATNNVAEYSAVVTALENIKNQISLLRPAQRDFEGQAKIKMTNQILNIQFFSDSSLLVNQVNGFFKVKNARIKEFIFKIRTLEQEIGLPINYNHVPREKNQVADDLVNGRD